jgi:hypothetical protein
MVGCSEAILERDLPAGELEICWEIPSLVVKHCIVGAPPLIGMWAVPRNRICTVFSKDR